MSMASALRKRLRLTWPTASLHTWLLAPVLLAMLTITLWMAHERFSNASAGQARMKQELARQAQALAQSVERELASSIDALMLLSYTDSLRRGNLAEFSEVVAQRPPARASWQGVFVADAQGQVLVDTTPDEAARRWALAQRPALQALGAQSHAIVSPLITDDQGRDATLVAVPVMAQGRLRHVLGTSIPVSAWQALLQGTTLPADSYASLFDHEHRVIARSLVPAFVLEHRVGMSPSEAALAQTGDAAASAGQMHTFDDEPVHAARQSLALSGWSVEVGMPAASLKAEQSRAMMAVLAAAAGCLLLGALLAWFISRQLTRPLRELATGRIDNRPLPVREIAALREAWLAAEAHDERARQHLQQQADEFETLFNGLPIALAYAQDTACQRVRRNPAMQLLMGTDRAAFTVLHDGQVLDPASLPLQVAASTGAASPGMLLELRTEGRSPVFVMASAVGLRDAEGQLRGALGAMVDITALKHAEQAGAALMAVEQAARHEAEAASRSKDEFLAMLGHELRNPLSAISSAVEVLNRVNADDELASSARAIIGRQTRHLAHMVGDLLEVSRVISGKVLLSRQGMDLGALVQRVASTTRLTGALHRHELSLSTQPVWIDADLTRIEQVVTNLLTNAIKYTPAGGHIVMSVEPREGMALVTVRDSGIGISPELLPRMFDLFVQGESSLDRRAGGLGLGLTLVRRLVELHGGTVSARSSSAGSEFEVRLPAIADPLPSPGEGLGTALKPRRVLIIEDNADALSTLRAMLTLEGHQVSTASDGVSGLDRLLSDWPEVAVVDIGLPGLDGYALAQAARSAGYPGRMIALSGYGLADDVRRALVAGFDAHLVKPVNLKALCQRLSED